MTVGAALLGGFLGSLALVTVLQGANELRLTRIDLPFLVGTALTDDRDRARAIGYAIVTAAGILFALVYDAVFAVVGTSGWGLGAALGIAHGVFTGSVVVNLLLPAVHPRMGSAASAASSRTLIEPPGFMMLNYGLYAPVVTVLAHGLFGAIVGGFVALGG